MLTSISNQSQQPTRAAGFFPFFQLPQDIFRVVFQYLSVKDLMKGEETFLINQQLLSLYQSSLEGFTLKEDLNITDKSECQSSVSWLIDHNVLVEKLSFTHLTDREINLLNYFRHTLKSISFSKFYSSGRTYELGFFPSLISATFNYVKCFTVDTLFSFFALHPHLETVKISQMDQLSNSIITHLSNCCPNIKFLSIVENGWVNEETISLLSQGFLNLHFFDMRRTFSANEETIRRFIISHPRLSGLILPGVDYSNDFHLFYLRQVILPSLLNNNNDLESHSLALSSLVDSIEIFFYEEHIVKLELSSVHFLKKLFYPGCSMDDLYNAVRIVMYLSAMTPISEVIKESQFLGVLVNHMSPNGFPPYVEAINLLFSGCNFQYIYPILIDKYQTKPSALISIFWIVILFHHPVTSIEVFKDMIPTVLNELHHHESADACFKILSHFLQESQTRELIDPHELLFTLNLLPLRLDSSIPYKFLELFECLKIFITINKRNRRLLVDSDLISRLLELEHTPGMLEGLLLFTKQCLITRHEMLIDYLVVKARVFHIFVGSYPSFKISILSVFKLLMKFSENKYLEFVKTMELSNELRSDLFG